VVIGEWLLRSHSPITTDNSREPEWFVVCETLFNTIIPPLTMRKLILWIVIFMVVAAGLVAWFWPGQGSGGSNTAARDKRVLDWIYHPEDNPGWAVAAGQRCADAPFVMPTNGFIGYLWDDSFRPGHRHSGLDIFGGTSVGVTPVYAAYPGYLTREADWKSSLIIRVPEDPLSPSRQIWLYYTHLADALGNSLIDGAFPLGTQEVMVAAGTLLGYQGNYSGTPGAPVGVHLHFSIVRDDGQGRFLNELDINNTLDPSPYLGIQLNVHNNPPEIPKCEDLNSFAQPAQVAQMDSKFGIENGGQP
jgi:peptidoglycan LD-endopeptidase LytH